jgi:hypothetical protein
MTRAERLADFETRKLLCDRCLYKVEQNEETPHRRILQAVPDQAGRLGDGHDRLG